MNETTKELVDKIEKVFDEYAMEDVESDVLKSELLGLIDNYS